MGRFLPPTVAIALLLLLTGCDTFDEYTIQNNTQRDLVTWPSFYGCDDPAGPNTLHERETVPAGDQLTYSIIWGGFSDGPKCVVVATTDRYAMLLAPFHSEATYVVNEAVEPGAILPASGDLNQDSFFEALVHLRVGAMFLLAVVIASVCSLLAVLLGAVFALFLTGKFFFNHYAHRRRPGGT